MQGEYLQYIIIIIINNAGIRVTLSWITLQGHAAELMVKTKRNETKYIRVKSVLRQRKFKKPCLFTIFY